MELGAYFREMRLAKDLSQADVAHHAGYKSPQFVSNVERGIAVPSPRMIKTFVDVCDANKTIVVDAIVDQFRDELLDALEG